MMKYWFFSFLLAATSCADHEEKVNSHNAVVSDTTKKYSEPAKHSGKEICWAGTLNSKTPVFIHYQLDSNLIIGEITYLNTKEKLPIILLGTVENSTTYRLLEFDSTGNITGVIEGKPSGESFNGLWTSPRTQKELSMRLISKDTLISSPNIKPEPNQIFGQYYYQYGKNGYNGTFDISEVSNNKMSFSIFSVTNVERGPNIAEVEKDTIPRNSISFNYKIPESDSCEFKVSFYRNFAYINYTRGYCASQFGLNATIDGIYLKKK